MKKYSFVILMLLAKAGFGQSSYSQIDQSVGADEQYYESQFNNFPDHPDAIEQFQQSGMAVREANKKFSQSDFQKSAQSSWEKAQIMQSMTTLATTLAQTAGTAQSTNAASQLSQYGSLLSGTSDPQYQQMGSLLTQEASQVESGNQSGATSTASQIAAIPPPVVTDTPTQGQSAFVEALNMALAGVFSSMGGVLGSVAVAQLLQSLGITGGLNSGLSGVGRMAGSSIGAGQSSSNVGTNAAVGAVGVGGGQAVGAVNQIPSVPANNTTGSSSVPPP